MLGHHLINWISFNWLITFSHWSWWLNNLLLLLNDWFLFFNMLLSSFLLHFSSPSLIIIFKLTKISMHLSNHPVLFIDYVDQILHFAILGPDHILQLAYPLISDSDLLVNLPHLRPEIIQYLSLIIQHASLLRDLPVTEIHICLDPRDLLLRTYHRLVAASDVPDVVQEVIEQSNLLVDCKLVLLHLLLDLRLHLSDVLSVHTHDTGLSYLGFNIFLDLGELDGLTVFVEELGYETIGQVLKHSLVGLQMLIFDRFTHESYLSLPSRDNLLEIRLQ